VVPVKDARHHGGRARQRCHVLADYAVFRALCLAPILRMSRLGVIGRGSAAS
jgi:hypothetical protein